MVHKIRAKTVDIAERFVAGATEGQSYSGSLFISGNTIYSYGYHFPIAKLDRRNKIAYFNKNRYSVTTSIHQGHVRRALQTSRFKIIEEGTEQLKKRIGD